MDILILVLVISIVAMGLVAGFFFTFSVILMPGLHKLVDKAYIESFRAVDSVLQSNTPAVATRPIFGIVFIGGILSLLSSLALGMIYAPEVGKLLLIGAVMSYILGVLLPTVRIHIPLNDRLQRLQISQMSVSELALERSNFETRWVKWNTIRTIAAIVSFILLVFAYKAVS